MAQFDFLIISTILFTLCLVFFIFYINSLKIILPYFSEIKKFRTKKIAISKLLDVNFLNKLTFVIY